ncbi:MAG TPA: tRNA pseudouridine(13) synthase TruD, partial [Myxococcaceae bacterium]
EVNRLGVVNYFDSQRFGSLKHGQGFIAKDLLRGDFEAALRNYLAKPSPLDRTDDAKVKEFWRRHWGDWTRRVPYEAAHRYDRVLRSLKEKPEDYLRAFLQIDAAYRALLLFTYQSWLWNEGVRRLLQLALPRTALFPMRYQAGTLLFHQDADAETLRWLRGLTFPLLGPVTPLEDPRVRQAVEWVLGKEKLRLEQLRIPGAERLLFFKHEERPVLVQPSKLVLGRTQPDELNRGYAKLNVAFTLPPGSYATLVVKRLFHHTAREDTPEEIQATPGSGRPSADGTRPEAPMRSPRLRLEDPRRRPEAPVSAMSETTSPGSEKKSSPSPGSGGFRERAKARKDAKAAARARQKLR